MYNNIISINKPQNIDGILPGLTGRRAFPNGEIRDLDPFLLLDQIGPDKVAPQFFVDGTNGAHPHRGFETITFLFEGMMNHKDSLGNKTALNSGSAQLMNAGSGIIHGGDFAADQRQDSFHEVQLWINVPSYKKLSKPFIQNVASTEIPKIQKEGYVVEVYSGKHLGVDGPIKTEANTKVLRYITKHSAKVELDQIDKAFRTALYVLKGKFKTNDQSLKQGDLVELSDDATEMTMEGSGEILFISGKPLNEPIAMGGPFVMNTQEEINQAYVDFRNGEFGKIVA